MGIQREGQRFLAEILGTFILVFVHAGLSIVWTDQPNGVASIGVGLSISALIYAFGDVSGAHLNPNVSIAFFLRRVFPFWRLCYYVVAQFIGGYAAALSLSSIFGTETDHLGSNRPKRLPLFRQVFVLEMLATWILLTVILRTANRGHNIGPQSAIAVGSTILTVTLLMGPFGVASMNMIRTLSVATLAGQPYLWFAGVFIGAQQLGVLLGVITSYLLDIGGHSIEEEQLLVRGDA